MTDITDHFKTVRHRFMDDTWGTVDEALASLDAIEEEMERVIAALREAMKYVALMPRADYDRLARLTDPQEPSDAKA